MLKNKFLKLLVILGIAGILTGGGKIVYREYRSYHDVVVMEQLQKDLMLPAVRIKVELEFRDQKKVGFGSGAVVYSEPNELGTGYDTYVMTCNHVVEVPIFDEDSPFNPFEGPKVKGFSYGVKYVEFFDRFGNSVRKVPARVVAHSPNGIYKVDQDGNMLPDKENKDLRTGHSYGEDIALLKLDTLEPFPVAKLPSEQTLKNLKAFDKIRVVGCALGDKPISTSGEITRIDPDFISINAEIIFGNSGGPCYLENTHELVGFVNMIRGGGFGAVTHMGFVRPLLRAYNWLNTFGYQFIYDKSVSSSDKFDVIQRDADEQKFKSIEEKTEFRKKIKALEGRNAQVSVLLDELKKKNDLIDELIRKVANAEEEIQKLVQHGGEDAVVIEELKKQVASLKEQIAELQVQLQAIKVSQEGKKEGSKPNIPKDAEAKT